MDPKIIVALDIEDNVKLQTLIRQLSPHACRLKVGKTLFTQQGPELIRQLHLRGFEVFLDLKFHDIPQQVAGACQQVAELGVWMTNVHAMGGMTMLQAAVAAIDKIAQRTQKKPILLGVTLLTSLQQNDIKQIGLTGKIEDNVLRLAELCSKAGLDGVVCSAHEVSVLKQHFGSQFLCVTPGIRLPEDALHDQQRVTTPQQAISKGSDYLVMGRSITHAANPAQILQLTNQEIVEAMTV